MKQMNASLTKTTAIVRVCLIVIGVTWPGALFDGLLFADDWPMLGRDGTRNSVSLEENPPTAWSVEERAEGRLIRETRGIRWTAALGSETHSSPVGTNGLVWIGTNNVQPGVEGTNEYHSVLKCFRVADGSLVYEYDSPKLAPWHFDPGWTGLGSSPLMEGDRLWLATNRSEVLCLDIGPLIRSEGLPRELWKLDLIKALDISPFNPVMGPPRPCSIGPSWNGRIFVTTNNGVGENHTTVPKPDAPSLVCLNKDTGEVLWKDNSPGANILVTQFASPTVAEIAGQVQVIVPQGDGWVRAFNPDTGAMFWEFDVNPKATVYRLGGRSNRNSLLGNAVVYENRVYIASGLDVDQGEGVGRLVCIDPTKRGDVSSELAVDADGKPIPHRRVQAVDPNAGEKAIPNPNSALVWEFISCGTKFEDVMHRSLNSVAVAKGLVIAADASGLVHCLDAATGQRHWAYDSFAMVWVSPLIVDDKVYVADEDGDVAVFGLSLDPDVAMKKAGELRVPLAEINMGNSICSSPCFANGTLYIASRNRLFAITGESDAESKAEVGGFWPQWRGPNRDNTSAETGLLPEWPEAGPPLLWRVDGLGEGIASVSIANGRIYTLGYFEEGEYLTCIDQSTAQRLWSKWDGPKVHESPLMRWLSQRTPTLDDDRIYVLTSGGRLVCLSAQDGLELWSKSYPVDFGVKRPKWGFCDYPLIDGDNLICAPGGAEATIVALRKETGEVVWKCRMPEGDSAAYAAMVVSNAGGIHQYVAFLEKGVVGVSAENGNVLWRYNHLATDQNSFTPIVIGDQILCASGRKNAGITLLNISNAANVQQATEQYHQALALNHFQDNLLILDRHVYGTTRSGPFCVELATGSVVWGGERQRVGSRFPMIAIVAAERHLYLRQSDGVMKLLDATPKGIVVKGHFTIPENQPSIGGTHPVIAGGRLYVRDDNKLLCYDIREDAPKQPLKEPLRIVFAAPTGGPLADTRDRILRSVFVPTPTDIVEKMLELANVKPTDVVCDLGSGDGRIVIAAAKKHGCKAVGYELDKDLVEQSRATAEAAGLTQLVTFEHKDLFTADLTEVDVLTVFLLPQQLGKLIPQIEKMKPGSRVISHQFEIPGIGPDTTIHLVSGTEGTSHALHLWTLPLKKAK